jgi:hypothetical protein
MSRNAAWLAGVALVATACSPTLEELDRVHTDDGLVDAVTFARQTDATVPTPTEIYLLPAGNGPSGEAIWRADKVRGLVVNWTSGNTLVIQAEEARVFLEHASAEVSLSGGGSRKVAVSYRIGQKL